MIVWEYQVTSIIVTNGMKLLWSIDHGYFVVFFLVEKWPQIGFYCQLGKLLEAMLDRKPVNRKHSVVTVEGYLPFHLIVLD